jgi:hypothetical protein
MWMFHNCRGRGGVILYKVNGASGVQHCIKVALNGQLVITKVDTGACVSVIGEHLYKTVLNGVPLSPTQSLRGYAGHPLEVMGECQVAVAHNSQEAELPVAVVRETSGKFTVLFGVSWLEKIRVNWEKLFPVPRMLTVCRIWYNC